MRKRFIGEKTTRWEWIAVLALLGCIITLTIMKSSILFNVKKGSRNQPVSSNFESRSGDLSDYIQSIVENELPRKNSEVFSEPTPGEVRDFVEVMKDIDQKDYTKAQALASTYNYSVLTFTDTGHHDALYTILKENAPYTRGWGVFITRPSTTSTVMVEVPHPKDDAYTGLISVELFRELEAKKLFLAGTHRDAKSDHSSDTAHNPRSLFHLLSMHFTNSTDWVIQPHGFTKKVTDPDMIISAGIRITPGYIPQINTALKKEGLDSQYFSEETSRFGATTNSQGKDIRGKGGKFVHIELSLPVRTNPSQYHKIAHALASVILQK